MADFIFQHKDLANVWHNISNYIILLSVRDKAELYAIPKALRGLNISFTTFTEPDLGNEITAIAVAPGDKADEYCRQFKLALSERDMLKKDSIKKSYKNTRKKLREHREQSDEIHIQRNDNSFVAQQDFLFSQVCDNASAQGRPAMGFVTTNSISKPRGI